MSDRPFDLEDKQQYEDSAITKSPVTSHAEVTANSQSLAGALAHIRDIPTYDEKTSDRLVRKFDIRLIPLLAFLYLLNALDKTNLANAKTDHFDKDIGLTGDQYYDLVTAFYAPFCVFGTPIAILIKRFSAARVLPIMALSFGTLSMCSAATKSFAGILVIRMLLAVSEAAVLPGVVFYLSSAYKRSELARRVGVFYAAASVAGAFGGLIAFGVFQIKHSSLKGWQILFLLEGGITVLVAVFLFLYLPRQPSNASFLSEEEKEVARLRLLQDASDQIQSKLAVKDAFKSLVHWHTVAWLLLEFCLGVPLASVSNFLPQVVARLGYSTVRTNLLTVAPNVVGAISLITITQSSDRFRERSIHLIFALAVTLIGFVILGTIDVLAHKGVSYFACFLLTAGSFVPSVLTSSWISNNCIDENRRAILVALGVGFANAAGLVSSNVFKAKDEPKYIPALITSACFGGAAIVLAGLWGAYMRWDNRRRDRAQGVTLKSADVDTAILREGPAHPSFRWMY